MTPARGATVGAGRFGPLRITVAGNSSLARSIAEELAPGDIEDVPDLEVRVGPMSDVAADYVPTTFSAKNHMSFNDSAFFADEPLRYVATRLFFGDSPAILAIDERSEQPVAAWRRRLGRTINASPALTYGLFWAAIAVLLLRHGATFVHAGTFGLHGRAYAIAGTGGSGKTSLLFEVLREGNAAFMSEDFGIVRRDGHAVYSPKAVSVYSSDLHAGSLDIQGVLSARPAWDRLKWTIHDRIARTTPMVKIPVQAVVDRTTESAPLDAVVYLIRHATDEIRIEEAGRDEVIDRLIHVAWREQKRLIEIVHMIRANAPADSEYPTPGDLTESMRVVLDAGLQRARTFIARVPATAAPERLLTELRSRGCLP